eukprot:2752880-Prorocentrum_lima.AAC.1
MTSSLVGSEMCIRDSALRAWHGLQYRSPVGTIASAVLELNFTYWTSLQPVSYTHLTLPTICSV